MRLLFLPFLLLLFACKSSDKLAFLCEPSGHSAVYRYADGTTESFTYDRQFSNYDQLSSVPIAADHDPRDPISLDVVRDDSSITVAYTIMLHESMFSLNKWKNKYASCKKIGVEKGDIIVRCENSGQRYSLIFTYSKGKGITSMRDDCEKCNKRGAGVLVSDYGIGRPCR